MRWRLTLFVLLLSILPHAFGQNIYWEKRTILQGPLTAENPYACQDPQCNTYIAGLAEAQLYIEKVNANGTLAWRYLEQSTTYTDTEVGSVAVNANGDVFIAGNCRVGTSTGPGVLFVLAFGPTGSLKWRAQLPDYGVPIQISFSGGGDPIVCTESMSLSRISAADGHLVWTQQFQSTNFPAIASRAGITYALVAPATLLRIDESTGKTVWSQTATPSPGFTQVTAIGIDVLPSGDLVYTGANGTTAQAPNGFVEILSQSDGTSLGRTSVPASFYSFPLTRSVLAAADGSIVWNGYDNALARGTAGKLSPTLQPIWTIEPGRNLFFAAPLANGLTSTAYEPPPSTPSDLRLAQVDTAGSSPVDLDAGTGSLSYFSDHLCAFSSNSLAVVGTTADARNNTVNTTSSLDSAANLHSFKDTPPVGDVNNENLLVDHDPQGNLYVASLQGSFCAVSKYSINGDLIWTTPIGGNPNSGSLAGWPIVQPASISYSPRGEVALAMLGGWNSGVFGVAKIDASSGKLLVSRLAGGGRGMYYMPDAIREDSIGDIVLVGGAAHSTADRTQVQFVAKFSGTTGSWQWLKEFPGFVLPTYWPVPGTNHTGMTLDSSDNILLSGVFQGTSSVTVNTTKLSSTGGILYSNHVGIGTFSSEGTGIACDSAGNAYVFATTSAGFQVLVYDASGSTIRQAEIASSVLEGVCGNASRLTYTPKLNAITLFANGTSGRPVVTIRLNASTLVKNWEDDFGDMDNGRDCAVDSYGNVVIVGGNSRYLPWIRKLRADTGAPVYSSYYQGAYSREGSGWAVTIGPDFYPVMVGNSDGPFGHGSGDSTGSWGHTGFLVKFRG